MTAQEYVAAIRTNVDAMYDDHITFEQFRKNQQRLWSEIAKDDTTHHNVLALLREAHEDVVEELLLNDGRH